MGRRAVRLQTSAQDFEHFLAPRDPGSEWGDVLHYLDAGE